MERSLVLGGHPHPRPRAGSGVVRNRIDPLRLLAGCRKRRLNQALFVLSLSLGFLRVSVVLLTRAIFCVLYFVVLLGALESSRLIYKLSKFNIVNSVVKGLGHACQGGLSTGSREQFWPDTFSMNG